MTSSTQLRRIYPDRNMARFYAMSLQPTLFGEWALLREWGRIGSTGRLVTGCFATEPEAAVALEKQRATKLRKGCRAV